MPLPAPLQRLIALLRDRDIRRNLLRLQTLRSPILTGELPPYLRDLSTAECGTADSAVRSAESAEPHSAEPHAASLVGTRTPQELRLASRTTTSTRWDQSFEDLEDFSALHRFAWLLPAIVDGASAAWMTGTIRSWVAQHAQPAPGETWHAYAIAERLMNWTLAALATGADLRALPDVAQSMRVQLDELASHLEYYGETLTGNHLSNDGRALYCVGHYIGDARAIALGREIVLRERARLFEEPGFHREGSSHYQFLLTRNYCEALWFAAAANDAAMVRELSVTVAQLAEGCRLLRVGNDAMPLIGDISPDCTPEWLLRVPEVADRLLGRTTENGERTTPPPTLHAGSGWHRLFADAKPVADVPRLNVVTTEWGRLDRDRWTVFTHANRGGAPRAHAHQDTGGLVAFFDGQPIVVECARRTYASSRPDGAWARGHEAHSLLAVDGLTPAPWWHWAYGDALLARLAGEPPRIARFEDALEIRHGGFARSSGVGVAIRRVQATGRMLTVTDRVDGTGRHRIDLFFHVVPENARLVAPPDLRVQSVVRAPANGNTWGWGAARYGDRMPLTSTRISGTVSLPWRGVSRIELA